MRILFVCLGNICRSPTVEGVARHLAAREAPHLGLQFDSAGTADYHIGKPPDVRSQRAAKARGYDISGLRARQLVPQDFERSWPRRIRNWVLHTLWPDSMEGTQDP